MKGHTPICRVVSWLGSAVTLQLFLDEGNDTEAASFTFILELRNMRKVRSHMCLSPGVCLLGQGCHQGGRGVMVLNHNALLHIVASLMEAMVYTVIIQGRMQHARRNVWIFISQRKGMVFSLVV